MRDELANAPEEWRDRAISGSAKPRLDHLLPRGRGPVRLPLSKWEDQDESHLTGRELLCKGRIFRMHRSTGQRSRRGSSPADFRNSDLRQVNFGGAYLEGAMMPPLADDAAASLA